MFEKVKKVASKLIYAVPVAVFLSFVFYITSMTYTGAVKKTVESTKWSFNSFVGLSNQFEKVIQKGIYKKQNFINLNGRIAKYLDFNSLNYVQKLTNGYLTWEDVVYSTWFKTDINIEETERRVIALNNFLSKRNISFLYVLVPSKNSIYDSKFAAGYGDEWRKNHNNMVKGLDAAGVNIINMDAWFEQNGWRMEDVFFKTDNHWLPQAGLVATRYAMELLQKQGIVVLDEEKLHTDSYKIETLTSWFLGSQGKRVGKYYAGLDDAFIYHPRFETKYFYSIYKSKTKEWFYRDNILDLGQKRKSFYERDGYGVYMYGDFTLRTTTNDKALNNKKVLILGDSYKQALEYFLSTQFQRIYTIDTRYYTDGSLAQYIEEIKPNIVIICASSNSLLNGRMYDFGVDKYNEILAKTNIDEPKILLGDFEIESQPNNENSFAIVDDHVEANRTYTLTIGSLELLQGKANHVQIALQDLDTNKAIMNYYFETGEGGKQKWVFTVPNKPNNYGIYLYAGNRGHTASNHVKVKDVNLQKGIHEDNASY